VSSPVLKRIAQSDLAAFLAGTGPVDAVDGEFAGPDDVDGEKA
jgi:hypothetical protein